MRTWILAVGLSALCTLGQEIAQAKAILIDHTSVAQVGSIPQARIDEAAAKLDFYFAHASVGIGMYQGLQALHRENPTRYPLDVVSTFGNAPPATVLRGTVYENSRGNPGWQVKVDSFAADLATGWGSKANVVMDKFCYLDVATDFNYYAISNTNGTAMSQLEALYPGTTFVYMTIPITIVSPADENSYWYNLWRNQFNEQLRTWAQANGKVLFDVADIEAWSQTGVETTYLMQGQTYQSLTPDYASEDTQHPNDLGYRELALGFYALGASLVPEPSILLFVAVAGALMLLRQRV